MNALHAALKATAEALQGSGRSWALVGGLAVSARAEPRFTRDADFAVAVANDAEAEALVFAMRERGFGVLAAVEQEAAKRLATARLTAPAPNAGVIVDLLFASSGIEGEVVREAERLEIVPDLSLPVARVGHLLALKVLSRDDQRRPQDAADIRALLAVADQTELSRAKAALALIDARGFARDKNLAADWEAAQRSGSLPARK
jgi:predicted nucleotidyltransferase